MVNYIEKLRQILPKRYEGKRVMVEKKQPRKLRTLKRPVYLALAALLTVSAYLGLSFKNYKSSSSIQKNSISLDQENKNTILNPNQSIVYKASQNYAYIPEKIEFKDDLASIEEKDLNLNVEINLLLEKHNMTYSDLIKLVLKPRYKETIQSLLTKYSNLTTNNLISILNGSESYSRETLFLGDSRTQGMLLSGAIKEENTVYGVGYGYNWLVGNGEFKSSKTNALNGAINGLESKMDADKSYDIVIWLGVNDYKRVSAETYFQEFSDLATTRWANHQIYIVSVGPVDDNKATTVNNAGINAFNAALKDKVTNSGLANLNYVDLALSSSAINRYDGAGLHYSASDYQNINGIITTSINENNQAIQEDILNTCYRILVDYDRIIGIETALAETLNLHK